MATSSSFSSGSSSSTSDPGLINSPQSDWALQLAQYLQQVGDQQMQWAQQEYARAGSVTDAQINNYIHTAQQGSDLAGGVLGRYNDLYAPMTDQYAREAGSYASQGRLQHEMGRAESGVMQAGRQAEINAEQELQGFGIDPSSGRYQDLVRASKTADAAAAAGAGETARRTTEMEGTRRKENAMNVGMQLPGAAVNALNSTYQGIAGAENAALGLANTGVNLTTSPAKYYDPAMSLKYPPVGNTSRSQSQQGSTSGSTSPSGSGGGSGGRDPFNSDRFGRGSGAPGDGGSSSRGNVPAYSNPNGSASNFRGAPAIKDVPEWGNGSQGYDMDQGLAGNGGLPGSYTDPWADTGSYDWGQGGAGIQPTNDPMNTGSPSPWMDTPSAPADWGGQDQSYSGPMGGTPDASFPDPSSGYNDSYGGSNYDSYDYSGSNSGGYDDYSYAGGGAIPSSMSPSGGQRVDDVPAQIQQTGGRAQLNVDEFVIPRDVTIWKGQEFFQKLIQQSRQARTGAPAKPSKGRP